MKEIQNSQAEFYLDLCVELLRQDPVHTSRRSLARDEFELIKRTKNEGLSFLTKALPKLGKALLEGLNTLSFTVPANFKRSHGNRNIPAFMQEYFKLVFDEDGILLESACVDAIKHLLQVLFSVYKLEVGYTKSEEAAVIAAFVETERELELGSDSWTQSLIETASHIAQNALMDFDPKDIIPRHGPGAVATGERLEEKWEFSRLYKAIHQVFPYYDYFIVGKGRELIDRLDWYKGLERRESGVAKVVLVPKDSRGPRLISCEPLEYQWIQQGIGRKLVHHLESSRITGGQINFTDQSVNRNLALESSISRVNATLDLKEASDRVSVELVTRVFSRTPELLRALLASRTTATKLPGGSVLHLNKFAPMGSALCFPVEATVFWCISVAAIIRETRMPLSVAGKLVFVYGDDIIVPTEYASLVSTALESVALKVNTAKCCIHGHFRESCGMDAFKGTPVTPVKIRTVWTAKRRDAAAYSSYVSYANSLFAAGYELASNLLWSRIEKVYGRVPYGLPGAGYICRFVHNIGTVLMKNWGKVKMRWNAELQRHEYKVRSVANATGPTYLDGWPRLLRGVVTPLKDVDPSQVVFPYSTVIKWGWRPLPFDNGGQISAS